MTPLLPRCLFSCVLISMLAHEPDDPVPEAVTRPDPEQQKTHLRVLMSFPQALTARCMLGRSKRSLVFPTQRDMRWMPLQWMSGCIWQMLIKYEAQKLQLNACFSFIVCMQLVVSIAWLVVVFPHMRDFKHNHTQLCFRLTSSVKQLVQSSLLKVF